MTKSECRKELAAIKAHLKEQANRADMLNQQVATIGKQLIEWSKRVDELEARTTNALREIAE